MGQKGSRTGDMDMCLEWPYDNPLYAAVCADDRAAVTAYYRQRATEETMEEAPGVAGMTFKEFVSWWAIPPPVVVGGSEALGRVEAWRAQCLGEEWSPSEETAPGLGLLRWYVPGRSGDWLSLYDSAQKGISRTLIIETIKLYAAPMVLVLRLEVGCFGIIFSRFPQRTAVFFAAGRKLSTRSYELPSASNDSSFIAAVKAIPVEEFGLPHLKLSGDFQHIEVLTPDLNREPHHHIRAVEVWGAGSDVDNINFKQRTYAKRVAEERARTVNRRHMAGDRDADMFILQAAGVVGERHMRPDVDK